MIMPTRIYDIERAIDGFDRAGFIGTAYYDGYGFENLARGTDDKGLYYFAQIMYNFFGFNTEQIIVAFHVLFIGLGFIMFCIGWTLFLKTNPARGITVIAMAILAGLVYKIGDVYVIFYLMSSFIPFFLYLIHNDKKKSMIITLIVLSILSIVSHLIRSYSFMPTILFIIIYLFLNLKASKKYFYIALLIFSLFSINAIYKIYEIRANQNLLELNHNANLNTNHVFWHSIYIGLGYVDNECIPHYLDEVAIQKVNSIDPSIEYPSKEYENILKHETFKFIKEHKVITIQNFGAKFGVMFLYFLIFSNIGFYCFCTSQNKKKKEFLIPCLYALCFNSIFGFLVIPSINYLIGFISFSVIFAIYYIDNYINEKRLLK